MNIYQTLLVLTFFSICFFISETWQIIFKTEHKSYARWKWSIGIFILDIVIVKSVCGEWWPLAILPTAVDGLTTMTVCLAVFGAFSCILIVSGDLIIKLFKIFRDIVNSRFS